MLSVEGDPQSIGNKGNENAKPGIPADRPVRRAVPELPNPLPKRVPPQPDLPVRLPEPQTPVPEPVPSR